MRRTTLEVLVSGFCDVWTPCWICWGSSNDKMIIEKDEPCCAEVSTHCNMKSMSYKQCECKVTLFDIHYYSKTKWMRKHGVVLDSRHIWNPFNLDYFSVNQSLGSWEDFKPCLFELTCSHSVEIRLLVRQGRAQQAGVVPWARRLQVGLWQLSCALSYS